QAWWGAVPNLWETYWGSYGWETFHIPALFYRQFLFFTVLSMTGVGVAAWRAYATKKSGLPWKPVQAAMFMVQAAFVVTLLIVLYHNVEVHSDGGSTHARFLMPALLASTLFLTTGMSAMPGIARKLTFAGYFSVCLAVI